MLLATASTADGQGAGREGTAPFAVRDVWLKDGGLGEATRLALDLATEGAASAAAVDAARAPVVAAHARRLAADVVGPFVAAARAAGFSTPRRGELLPFASVGGPVDALDRWLAGRADVAAWTPDAPGGEPELAISVPAVGADWIRTHPTTPLTGAGVAVCVLDTAGVAANNPFLPAGIIFNGAPTTSAHATACAGIVASSEATRTGVAPGVSLLSTGAGVTMSSLASNAEWACLNGADVVTCSLLFGSTTNGLLALGDRAFDYLSRTFGRTFVKSAGNQGNGGFTTTPGRGWNTLAVGAFDPAGTARWSDDAMWAGSSGVDPSTGAPKPELAAPGVAIESTLPAAPWIGPVGNGTSFAAPHVAGLAALLMEQDPALKGRPEAVRALVGASAWHDVEGAADLSELDGVGAIDAAAAFNARAAGRVLHGTWFAGAFAATGFVDFAVPLAGGNLARAELAWSSNAASAATNYAPDGRDAIFELAVFAPGATTPLALAPSHGGAWRLAGFFAPVSGTYVFRATATQFLGGSEPYGFAVSQRFDGDGARILGVGPAPLGSTAALTLSDPRHAGLPWLLGVGVSGGSYDHGVALTERTLPFVPDFVTTYVLTPGNGVVSAATGLLDASGLATTYVTTPAIPELVGVVVSFGLATFDGAAVDGIAGVSPRYAATITP